MDESQPKTLYVGNLDGSVSEDLLIALFSQMGSVKSCKIIREPGNDPYAFIEYATYQSATTALTAMNKRLFLDKEIKVSKFCKSLKPHWIYNNNNMSQIFFEISWLERLSYEKNPTEKTTNNPCNKK